MLRVLQICNYMYPHLGGIEQVSRDIAGVLTELDVEQKVICFNETALEGGMICKRKETVHDTLDGVEIIRCGCIAKVASQSISLSFGHELNKVMDSFRPEVIVFHYPNPFQAHYLLHYLKRDFKLIIYWHLDITRQKVMRHLFSGQSEYLLKKADKIIATSPQYIEGSSYLSRYREKCTIIPNCISPEHLMISPSILKRVDELRAQADGKILCFTLGRHVPYKGLSYLISAARILKGPIKIMIGGEGPLTERLKREAANNPNIEFLGKLSMENLLAYYCACDIFCFPSITKNEAFGIALAEAMFFGKPAVTFHIPGSGVNYVNLNGVTGIECPNRDVTAYATAIQKLASSPRLRKEMGQNAKKRILDNFTIQQFEYNIKRMLEELYADTFRFHLQL